MSYNIKIKNGIAFNLDDPHQLKQYEYICEITNVSAYFKRLITLDMLGKFNNTPPKDEGDKPNLNEDLMLDLI